MFNNYGSVVDLSNRLYNNQNVKSCRCGIQPSCLLYSA